MQGLDSSKNRLAEMSAKAGLAKLSDLALETFQANRENTPKDRGIDYEDPQSNS
jgi:hypothetical protein